MDKAKQRALEEYPEHSVLIQPARRGGYFADAHLREGFVVGYHQAEKDLALTSEDVGLIFREVLRLQRRYSATEGCYPEIAEWFNKLKQK